MSDKTIKDRGISTTTLSAPLSFGFDKTTRQLELLYYYDYSVANTLITVTGEQSRTNLIKKTFNDKGGVGDVWDAAMRDWLQDIIPSAQTDLYKLWLAYFTKYATTNDPQGVQYAGLSVEAAYRKFLTDHIGGAAQPFDQVFTDTFLMNDSLKLILKKIFSDNYTMQDAANFFFGLLKTFSDSFTLSDALLVKQVIRLADSYTVTDDFVTKLVKAFFDTYTMTDSAAFTKGVVRVFSDSFTMTDTLNKLTYIYRFSDSFSMQDALGSFEGGYGFEGYGENGYSQ